MKIKERVEEKEKEKEEKEKEEEEEEEEEKEDNDDIVFVGYTNRNNNQNKSNNETKSYDASDGGVFLDDVSHSDVQFSDVQRHNSDSEQQVQQLLNEQEQQDNGFGDRMVDNDVDIDDDIDDDENNFKNDRQEIVDSNNMYHLNLKGYDHSENIKLPTFSSSNNSNNNSSNSNSNNNNNNNNSNNINGNNKNIEIDDVDFAIDGEIIPKMEGKQRKSIMDDLKNYSLDEYLDSMDTPSNNNKNTTTATTTSTFNSNQNDIDSKYDPKTTKLFSNPIILNKTMVFIKGKTLYRCRFLQSTLSKPIDLNNEHQQKRVQELAFVLLEQKGNIQFIKNDRFILSLRTHSKNSYNEKFIIANQRKEEMKFCRNKFTFIIQRL
ncbi:hypothetical protein ACTA71_011630 [Dictyostelium dimigraforme]